MVFLCSVLMVCCEFGFDGGHSTANAEDEEVAAKVLEAALAAREGLRSGNARGTVRTYDGTGALIEDIAVHARFDSGKYNLHLAYRKVRPNSVAYDRRIAVGDGSGIFVNRFTDDIRPSGCEIDIHPPSGLRLAAATEGYRWNPTALGDFVLNVPLIMDKFAVRFESLPDGTYRGTYDPTSKFTVTFRADPKVGYNIVEQEGRNKVGGPTYDKVVATWSKEGHVWYIDSLTTEKVRSGALKERTELKYTVFKVNVAVAPDLFTLSGLEPVAGMRIIDRRPEARDRILLYEDSRLASRTEGSLDNMIAEAAAMPPKFPDRSPKSRMSSRTLFFVGLSVILTVTSLTWYLWRRKQCL